jgi:hypothetical protein
MPVTRPHLYMLTHQLTNAYLAAAMPTIKRCTSECSGRGDKETATREATCRIVCHAHGLALRIPLEPACDGVGRRLIRQFSLFT